MCACRHFSSAPLSGARAPSIAFRFGKRSGASTPRASAPALAPRGGAASPPAAAAAAPWSSVSWPAARGVSYLELPPAFGRPALSPAEAASITSGGAYLA